LRPPDLLAIERDDASRPVFDQEFQEVSGFEARLVSGRDHISERNVAAVGGTLEVPEQATALTDESNAVFHAPQRLTGIEHVQHHAVDMVGDAETMRADER